MQFRLGDILICFFILLLCILNFISSNRIMLKVGKKKRSTLYYAVVNLPSVSLILVWAAIGFPLPLFYIGIFLLKAVRICLVPLDRTSKFFLLSFPFSYRACVQMLFISICALIKHSSMHLLLDIFLYRGLSIVIFLVTDIVADSLIFKKKVARTLLDFTVGSEEMKSLLPLIGSLVLFTFVDSVLCFSDPIPVYSPLFLATGNVMLLFYIYQFISHVYSIFKTRQMEERYRQMNKMERQYEQKNRQLWDMAYTDPLTGILSRRYAMEKISELKKSKTPFSLIFIDLDRLKLINDGEGHNAGDRYLIRFTEIFASFLDKEDTFARIGGDEFLVLMPQYHIITALQRMKEIRLNFEEDDRWNHLSSFSYGATEMDGERDIDGEDLLKAADKAMYEDKQRLKSKHAGRDK